MIKAINILKITGYTILFLAVAAGFIAAVSAMQSCNKISLDGYVPTRIDTVLDVRYKETVKHDTVIRTIEKPFYVKGEPVLIEYKKVDTVFISEAKKLDLILSLTKSGNKIEAYTINFNDTLLKRTMFVNVGNDFSITSQAGKTFIKSKRFYWNGLNAGAEYKQPLDSNIKRFSADNMNYSLTTGFSYFDDLFLDAGFNYEAARNNISLTAKLTYRIFK